LVVVVVVEVKVAQLTKHVLVLLAPAAHALAPV
jgi:hypothetical protein